MKIAYFAQHQVDELIADESAYEHVRRLMPDAPEAKVRARTGAIGFSQSAADTVTSKLSGGEKARLLLGLATFGGTHVVILDEPTNHLDIDSRAALIEAINDYPGTVILVSHDRYLLDACAERLLLVADGHVTPFEGDLRDYQRYVLSGGAAKPGNGGGSDQPRLGRAEMRRASADKRAALADLRKRVRGAEAATRRLETEIARLDAALAAPDAFATDPGKAAALAKARSDAASKLAAAEEEWLSASAAYEAASA